MTKISELQNGARDVTVEAAIDEISEPRPVQTKFGPTVVANATLKDASGKIDLVLWGKKISEVAVGNKVKITGAYVSEWNKKLQLNVPKTGEMTIL
jgi:ssDNA-binding replication factor A large subunit